MGLSERLKAPGETPPPVASPGTGARPTTSRHVTLFWEALRARLHQQLIARLDLSSIEKLPPEQVTRQLHEVIAQLMTEAGEWSTRRCRS